MELQYKIQPFWFWNGAMEEAEIKNQIEKMHSQKIPGFIIHPRQGMTIPYLSEVYFDRVRLAVDTARLYGMEVWLYDEYPYPSGVTGGEVMLKHPEYQCRQLELTDETVREGQTAVIDCPWGEVLFARAYQVTDGKTDWDHPTELFDQIGIGYRQEIFQISGLTAYNKKRYFTGDQVKRLSWKVPEGNGTVSGGAGTETSYRILIVTETVMKDFKYFGTYVDTMNPAAIRCYLDTTHEVYKKKLGDTFGETVKGIFTDEITAFPPERPWSPLLPAKVEALSGISLLDWLPVLFDIDMGPRTKQVRYAYWNGAARAFMDSYDKQVYQWCEDNHLKLIGEKPIMRAAEMEFCHYPGMEVGHQKVGDKPNLVPGKYRANGKLAASCAHFYHKPAALCESYHSIGWGMTLQDMKWILDWVAVQGISWYIAHAFFYTTDGLKKHDAPPSSFFQMPWWDSMHQLSDYAEGLTRMIQDNRRPIHTLVLDPAAAIWSETDCNKAKLKKGYQAVQRSLLEHQMDYYIIDPWLLSQSQIEVRDGKTCAVIEKEAYDTIIVSPGALLEPDCGSYLEEYAKAGGILCFVGNVPYEASDGKALWTQAWFGEDLKEQYCSWLAGIPGEEKKKGTCLYVPDENAMCETLAEHICSYQLKSMDETGLEDLISVEFLDKEDRIFYYIVNLLDVPRSFSYSKPGMETAALRLEPLESRVIYEEELRGLLEKPSEEPDQVTADLELSLDQTFSLKLEGMNAMRFYYWDMSTPDHQHGRVESMPVIEQLEKGGFKIGVETRKNFGCIKELILPVQSCEYHTGFLWKRHLPMEQEAVYLLMEPETIEGTFTVLLNDHLLIPDDFSDIDIYSPTNQAVDVSAWLKEGENQLTVKVNTCESFGGVRNPLYLFGDFGVELTADGMAVVSSVTEGFLKNQKENKIPFYAGKIHGETRLMASGRERRLSIHDPWLQDAAEVRINGTSLGSRCYVPYQYEIPQGILSQGSNRLEIILSNTLIGLYEGQYFDREAHAYKNYDGIETELEDYAAIIYT